MSDLPDMLMEELKQAPLLELLGIVDASGAGGTSGPGNEWLLQITFASWKQLAGPLETRELTIRKPVSEKELHATMKQLSAYDIIQVQAQVAETNCFGKPQGLLVRIVRKDIFDADLKRRVEELKQPVTFKDSRLGLFTLDRRLDWYRASVDWGGADIQLDLSTPDGKESEVNACLAVAHSIWDLQSAWSERITNYAAVQLLSSKNDNWLEDDEKELSAEQFKSRLSLNSITVSPNGEFEFWYDDGDLFLGHSIKVSGSLAEGPTDAGIAG